MKRLEPLSDLDAYDLIADITLTERDVTETNLKRLAAWALSKAEQVDALEETIAELLRGRVAA